MDQPVDYYTPVKQEPLENEYNTAEQPQNEQPTLPVNVRLLDLFCRLCLRQRPNLIPVVSYIGDMSVPEVYRAVTGLEMILDDTYPLKTCRTCVTMLNYAFDVRQNFADSYQLLKSFMLSKTQPVMNNLIDYQGKVRATSETAAERILREYRDLMSQRETVNEDKVAPKLNTCVINLQSQEESKEPPVQIKQELEINLEPEELPDPTVAAAEAQVNNTELSAENTLQEHRDLTNQKETVERHGTAPNLNPCTIIPQPKEETIEFTVLIEEEPELILEPEELPDSDSERDSNKCFICNKTFEVRKDVQVHLSEHMDMIPYQCSTCTMETGREIRFTALDLLHMHFRMHVPNKQFFYRHKYYHTVLNEARYPCSYCDKKFLRRTAQIQHERTHQNPYQCKASTVCLSSRILIDSHISMGHPNPEQQKDGPILTCKFDGCDFSTTKKSKYYRHKAIHELKFQCSECSQSFADKRQLKIHQFIHTGVKKFPCQQCDQSFRYKQSLYEHIAEHNNDRPHACEFCGKTFVRKGSLKQHRLTHSA